MNAAGAKAGYLARKLGIYLPVEPRKRCVFVLSCPGAPNKHQMPLIIDTTGCYVRPESGSYLCGMPPPEVCTDMDDLKKKQDILLVRLLFVNFLNKAKR